MHPPTHIMQIVNVRLTAEAANKLSHRAYGKAENWLNGWTPKGNFKAVLGTSRDDALDKCRKMLAETLVPTWMDTVHPSHFEFEVSDQEIENGMFWLSSNVVWCRWHKVIES